MDRQTLPCSLSSEKPNPVDLASSIAIPAVVARLSFRLERNRLVGKCTPEQTGSTGSPEKGRKDRFEQDGAQRGHSCLCAGRGQVQVKAALNI